MDQADSVLSTPPTNTSAIEHPQSPDKPHGEARATPLYFRTPVTPEEAFQAIGRLRKEARAEIERLLNFLDDTDNHMELEPDGTDDEDSDPGEDGADDEPSLGSHELRSGAVSYLPSASLGEIDVEGEHDGREPDVEGEPLLGSTESMDQRAWGRLS
ncbi:MAG: hypothetical protein Q7T45_23435 [Bradyrhizobium sp.]|uniref:hypothetical protein n=1 Tax=Bradyrhizobium sp. TaxID=376 RepID=UPI00272471A0|nr:hypothetical protein [Bradyrhizobium sp.]MDO8400772.1 hypothetical protein [Bradyrhizobium sp.]